MNQDQSIVDWLSNLPTGKKWILIAGGIISVSAGGYLVYKQLSKHQGDDDDKSLPSPDLPSDPHPTIAIPESKSKLPDKKQAFNQEDVLLRVQRIKDEGNKCFQGHDYEKALTFYDNAINICPAENKPMFAALHQNKAAVYEKLNQYANVYEECSKALEFDRGYVKALSRRGNACQKLENWAEASHDFVKCSILEHFTREETTRKADVSLKTLSRQMAKEYMKKRELDNKPRPLSKTVVKSTLKSFGYDPVLSTLNKALNDSHSKPQQGQGEMSGVIIDPATGEEDIRLKNESY